MNEIIALQKYENEAQLAKVILTWMKFQRFLN